MGEREIVPVATDTVTTTQNDSCIKTMGNDESHFNVSLTVRDKVTRQCPQTTIFEEKGEPKRIRTEVRLSSATYRGYAKPAHYPATLHYTCCSISDPTGSRVAQWKRAGPITQRSVDRNHALLILSSSVSLACCA